MAHRWLRQIEAIWLLNPWRYRWIYGLTLDTGNDDPTVAVAAVHRFMRRDVEDEWTGDYSFMYGKSVSNQQIEAWWSILGKYCARWWMDFFKKMRSCGFYGDDCIEVECLKFYFMLIWRDELHRAAKLQCQEIRGGGRAACLWFLDNANRLYSTLSVTLFSVGTFKWKRGSIAC